MARTLTYPSDSPRLSPIFPVKIFHGQAESLQLVLGGHESALSPAFLLKATSLYQSLSLSLIFQGQETNLSP